MDALISYITSPEFYISAAVAVISFVIWLSVKKAVGKVKADDVRQKHTVRSTLAFLRAIILAISVLIILQINNVNVTSLLASLGIASAIVGLALQDLLKDIIMSIHIRSDNFFKVGDVVRYNGIEGQVTHFTAKSVKIKDICDGSVYSVCNRNISEITVVSDVLDVDLPLPYEEPQEKVYTVLSDICKTLAENEKIDGCKLLGTYSFDASSIAYKVRINCNPVDRLYVRIIAYEAFQKGLNEANITVPYQQIDVHTK